MNAVSATDRFPPASDLVSAMWDRVLNSYPRTMSVVATAVVQAGGDRSAIVRMVGKKANRSAFLIGCCAEELVSTGFVLKGREARRYIGEIIDALRPHVTPIRSKRVAPDFRRLLTDYEQHPVRMRVKTVQYMLAVNGLKDEQAIVSDSSACQLQIECSVMMDGITGCLIEMMKPEVSASSETAAVTIASIVPGRSFPVRGTGCRSNLSACRGSGIADLASNLSTALRS
ncbi:MAG: hypothetical protein MEQ84_02530 [Mesorhizobium sp.]|nr:hypothetical protein [Mesorhizobium sp.]